MPNGNEAFCGTAYTLATYDGFFTVYTNESKVRAGERGIKHSEWRKDGSCCIFRRAIKNPQSPFDDYMGGEIRR